MSALRKFGISTERNGLTDITEQVNQAIRSSGIENGICVVYSPHTTAGITINENADPAVGHDIILGLDSAFPDRKDFTHLEGNSHAHLKSSSVGASQTLILEGGEMILGTWQAIYFCEFDGPRERTFYVKAVAY